jgi:hypothetical protein
VTSGWGLLYALYRGYYAFGGTVGMIGRPADQAEWRTINLIGAVALLAVAVLPVAALRLWRRPRPRRVLLMLCWVLAIGFVMHALVMDTQRVLSLAGALHIHYPAALWATRNNHAADVQDLAFNETWFLAEGLLWGMLGWLGLGPSPARRGWTVTAIGVVAALTALGLLTTFGDAGRLIIF